MCFHYQKVKGFVSVVFPFSEKHNCKQKFVKEKFLQSLQIALLMRLLKNNKIYTKFLSLFQLSQIYNLLCQKDNHEQKKWAYRLLSKNNDNSQWCALVMNVFSTRLDTSHANEDIDTKMTD